MSPQKSFESMTYHSFAAEIVRLQSDTLLSKQPDEDILYT